MTQEIAIQPPQNQPTTQLIWFVYENERIISQGCAVPNQTVVLKTDQWAKFHFQVFGYVNGKLVASLYKSMEELKTKRSWELIPQS